MQIFDGMHAYKQGKTGVYYRGLAGTAHIKNSVVAEAPIGWFGTGNQEYFDSVFVGISENYQGSDPADEDFYYHADSSILAIDRGSLNSLFKGWGLYDGSNYFKNVTFDYPAAPLAPMYLDGKEITPTPISIFGRAHFGNHVMEQIYFVNDPYRRVTYGGPGFSLNWKFVAASESNYDIDGSLFGAVGFLRPDIPFNDLASDCVQESNTEGSTVLRCQAETQSIKIQMDALMSGVASEANKQTFKVERSDTGASVGNSNPNNLFSKFQVYPGVQPPINYTVSELDFKGTPKFNLLWIETFEMGDWTPLIVIDGAMAKNLAPGCAQPSDYVLNNWPNYWPVANTPPIYKAQSLGALRTFSDQTYAGAYYQHAGSGILVLKLQGKKQLAGAPHLAVQHKGEGKFELECP